MGLLQKLGSGQGWLKAGFLGFPKSGKTFTAITLAIGIAKIFNLKEIAMLDTEGGSEYIADSVKNEIGSELVGLRTRSFDDLMVLTKEITENKIQVFVVDSVTHIWRELCESYLKQVNEIRKKRNLNPRTSLEFQDWNPIKTMWAKWTDWYLNSKCHVIICGRAGFEYDFHVNEETGKRELEKTGVKMKAESEFGFEPSLLIEMEREFDMNTHKIMHKATILGDRFNVIDGQVFINPTFDSFKPHVDNLIPGATAEINTEIKTDFGINDNFEDKWKAEKKQCEILLEEIQGLVTKLYPSSGGEDKKGRLELFDKIFSTRSWIKIESLKKDDLTKGLENLKQLINKNESEVENAGNL